LLYTLLTLLALLLSIFTPSPHNCSSIALLLSSWVLLSSTFLVHLPPFFSSLPFTSSKKCPPLCTSLAPFFVPLLCSFFAFLILHLSFLPPILYFISLFSSSLYLSSSTASSLCLAFLLYLSLLSTLYLPLFNPFYVPLLFFSSSSNRFNRLSSISNSQTV
jgi:hypothetical protein